MKKLFYPVVIIWILISLTLKGNCQYNLVPNPSFEIYDTCPSGLSLLKYAPPWNSPMNSSPDYHNSCSNGIASTVGVPQNLHGHQFARTGNAYVGIISYIMNGGIPGNFREYIQSPLLDTLISGENYYIQFFVSSGDSCRYVTNNIGAYFSSVETDTTISPNNPLPYQPQISNSLSNNISNANIWTKVSGFYTANGNEKFIIIGNFNNGINSDAIFTGWGTNSLLNFAVHYIDDVLVTPTDSLTSINQIYPDKELLLANLNGNEYEISSKVNLLNSYTLYNNLGQILKSEININEKFFNLSLDDFSNGIYILNVTMKNDKVHNYKLLKN